jgi:hypothetical protein
MRPMERKKPRKGPATGTRYLPMYGDVALPTVREMARAGEMSESVLRRRLDLACEAGVLRRFRV